MDVRIGISGWAYAPWRGFFYPEGLPARRELAFASAAFGAIEVNGTFYRLQTPQTYARWVAETPGDFLFAVKAPRFITHMRRLRGIEAPLANFFASGILRLGPKLGPVLWQLPPDFRFDAGLIGDFLALLPATMADAATLSRAHDAWLEGRVFTEAVVSGPLRHAVEIRNDSFLTPDFVALLRRHKAALVIADAVDWPCRMDLTANFVYCRLHGSTVLYSSRYSPAALDRWARRVRAWSEGRPMTDGDFIASPEGRPQPRDVFVFFDNTDKRHAPQDAAALARRLGIGRTVEEAPPRPRRRLG